MTKEEHLEVEALCPECGHAFKAYVDRLIPEEKPDNSKRPVSCPVCGCGQCDIAWYGETCLEAKKKDNCTIVCTKQEAEEIF